jgi:hypothetical protein
MNQAGVKAINRSIAKNETRVTIKKMSQHRKAQDSTHMTQHIHCKISRDFMEELISMLLKLSHKIEMKGSLPISFYKASSIYLPKPGKDATIKL